MTSKKTSLPWYKGGLPFACTQCGKCCTGGPGFVWVTEKEMAEMAQFLRISVKDFKRLYVKRRGNRFLLIEKKSQEHRCIFYQDQKCQVYQARPLQCRTYPFWPENIASEENWKQAAKDCEGIYPQAPLVPYNEIERHLQQQDTLSEGHYVPNSGSE